ncbi:MAG: lipoyl(octanoyl) transferase LipB [Bacteroidetes bacterium]|nr:lipoyl(octanoyl) transferase LipB [Bacteroidota bacterium]
MSSAKVRLHDLGLIDYKQGWDFQEQLFNRLLLEKRGGSTTALNHLILCEHPHVYTLGKSGDPSNLLADNARLTGIDAQFYQINRGGDITYHGPGQLVVYPIFDLEQFFTDIHRYMRYLEEAVIKTVKSFGITATRIEGLTGVWLPGNPSRKIAAFGVKCSRWVTMHGIGFNVNTDLSYFNQIVPCGITDKAVTSMAYELGHEVSMVQVKESMVANLRSLFEFELT